MSDMLQRVDASAKQWFATLMVKAGQRVKTLKAFGSALSSIVGSDSITEEGLCASLTIDLLAIPDA